MTKRPQSQPDRDVIVHKHATPAAGIPTFLDEDCTGKHEGDDLREMRARRPTDERVGRLEDKHDELVASVGEWRIETTEQLGNVNAGLGKLTGAVEGLRTVVDSSLKRDHVTFTAKTDVDKAQQLDAIDARQAKRKFWLYIAAAVTSGGAVAKILQAIGVM